MSYREFGSGPDASSGLSGYLGLGADGAGRITSWLSFLLRAGGCDSASARRARAGPRARARFVDLQGPAGCLPAARRRRGSRRRGRRSGAQRVKAAGAAARGGESAAPAAAGLREPAPRDRSGLSAARAERAEPGAAAPSLHLDPRKLEDGDRRRELRVRLLTRPGGCGGGHGGGDGNQGPGVGAGRV